MKHKTTWVLIADGGRGRVVEYEPRMKGIHEVPHMEFSADHRPSHELGADKPTRVYESQGAARHASEPKTDPHRALKASFAERLAGMLDDQLAHKKFDHLIVAAPPVMLGDLRKALSDSVKRVIVAEVAKDLTKVPNGHVVEHLGDLPSVGLE